MTLDDIEDELRKKFLNKECRIRGSYGGSETTYDDDNNPIVRVIAGQEFKKVVDIYRMSGPPSGWTWGASFTFEDGTISSTFMRMSDVEEKKE